MQTSRLYIGFIDFILVYIATMEGNRRSRSCTYDVSNVGVLQTLALATRHTLLNYKYRRRESNP